MAAIDRKVDGITHKLSHVLVIQNVLGHSSLKHQSTSASLVLKEHTNSTTEITNRFKVTHG